MNTIVLSTNNKGKLKEFKAIGERIGFEIKTRDEAGIPKDFEVVEDGTTFEENSYKKAYEIMQLCGKPTMADDSGLMIDALGGAPGVYSSRFAGEEGNDKKNYEKALAMLEGVPHEKRTAHFTTVITLVYPDGEKLVAKGICEGHIAEAPEGEEGFGYDPIFVPLGYEESFAQMGAEIKNKISHRAKALIDLEKQLEMK